MNISELNSKRVLHTETKPKMLIRRDDNTLKEEIEFNTKMWSEKKRMISKMTFDNLLRKISCNG